MKSLSKASTRDILHTYAFPHRFCVRYAYACANEVRHLLTAKASTDALDLVQKWLDDANAVTKEELKAAADKAYAAYAASFAASYAASTAASATSSAFTAYTAAHNAYAAADASYTATPSTAHAAASNAAHAASNAAHAASNASYTAAHNAAHAASNAHNASFYAQSAKPKPKDWTKDLLLQMINDLSNTEKLIIFTEVT